MEAQQLTVFIDFERLIANVDKAACDKLREYFPNHTRELEEPDSRSKFEIADLLPNKLQQKLDKIYTEKGLISNVNAFPNALNALHQMKSYGMDVKIVLNTTLIGEKVEWINTKLGADWNDRIIVIKDKTLLKGDYFLDTQIVGSSEVSWKQVIVETSYNKLTDFGDVLRMSSLTDWKKLVADTSKENTNKDDSSPANECIAFFRHGSQDSRDIDVLYQFDKMPDNEADILRFEQGNGNEDRNIFTIDPIAHVVKDCHRGIPDEVNNALLATYPLHEQKFQLSIKKKLPRAVITRTAVCVRVILITLRRIESIREKVVAALNSNSLKARGKALEDINLTKLGDNLDKDDWKLITFHLAQTFWLIQGREVYTKKEILQQSPTLKRFINREQEKYTERELQPLEQLKNDVVSEFNDSGVIINKDNLNMFKADEEGRSMNLFLAQSMGTIIDIRTERTVFWPCTDPMLNEQCSWPTTPENHPMCTAILNCDFHYIGVFLYEGNCWICSPKQNVLQRDDTMNKKLDLSKYWYVFARGPANNKIQFGDLLAVIDRVTLSFVDDKTFQEQLEQVNNSH